MAKKTTHDEAGKPRVLVVEDDTFLAGMYLTKFGLEGFTVELASDGREGVKKAKEWKPDIMLLDLVLPVMDGFTVLETVRNDPDTKTIPVILLTNLGQKSDVERGMKLGASDYLIKAHFMPSEVIEKVKRFLKP